MLIGSRLQKLRTKRKITQKALSEKSGISRSYLADVEHNRCNPSLDTIEALANALKLDLKSFFDDAILDDSFYLKPLSEEVEEPEKPKSLYENIITEKKEPLTLPSNGLRDIGNDLDMALKHLDDLERSLLIHGNVLDMETRKLLKESLENSMRMAKVLAKTKFSPNNK